MCHPYIESATTLSDNEACHPEKIEDNILHYSIRIGMSYLSGVLSHSTVTNKAQFVQRWSG